MAGGMGTWVREHVWEIPLRRYLSLLLAAALVAGGVFGVRTLMHDDRRCAPGVSRPAGSDECVGVATGVYDFGQPRFHQVVEAIGRENKGLKSGSYVTVALMLPFTSTSTTNLNDIEHQLQGAYLAQYSANHDSNGQSPQIRLLLANSGTGKDSWRPTVDQLDGMTRSADRLRAVAGIGQSTDPNQAAVAALTKLGIPVIGSSITADELANGQRGKKSDPYPGLARVAPTNTDEARALASYTKAKANRANENKAMLVYDKPGDPYTNSLKQSFSTLMNGSPYQPVLEQPFTPPADRSQEGTTANTFRQITNIVCDTPRDTHTILFAGRHTQLRQFVNALGDRGCMDRSFQVLTGDEASYLTYEKELNRDALRHNLTVLFTSLAHPDAWLKNPPKTGGSTADYQTLQRLLKSAEHKPAGPIGPVALDDGQLIIGYDALQLAVHGIREAVPEGRSIPTLADVGLQWPQVKGSLKVAGASGWICLDEHGNPYDKAVPIVRLTPEGDSQFVQLAWPEGKPPGKDCLPPA